MSADAVAQIVNLLYRRLVIGDALDWRTLSRLAIGATREREMLVAEVL